MRNALELLKEIRNIISRSEVREEGKSKKKVVTSEARRPVKKMIPDTKPSSYKLPERFKKRSEARYTVNEKAFTELNAREIIPAPVMERLRNKTDEAIQTIQQDAAVVTQNIKRLLTIPDESNFGAKTAIILGDRLAHKGAYAIAPQLITAFGGEAGGVVYTNESDQPAIDAMSRYKKEIVVAGSYQTVRSELRKRGYTNFIFLLSEDDATPEGLNGLGKVIVLSNQQITGLLAKYEAILQDVRSELRVAQAA